MAGLCATARIETPLGPLSLSAAGGHLTGVSIAKDAKPVCTGSAEDEAILREAGQQLEAWFAGTLRLFNLPLAPSSTSEGEKLRAAIAAIAYGETRTYGEVASTCGSAARAVGQACRTNAFPIIIPCHRIVSASGPPYYSAAAGPRTKSWLIDFEYGSQPLKYRNHLL